MATTATIRKDFPILKRKIHKKPLIYFDNAATTQKPKVVLDALVSYYEKHNANIHRGIHTLADEATEMYNKARQTVADFIGAKSEEIVFVRNSTEALNLVAYSWGKSNVKKGDEILLSEYEHHSNIVPWQLLAKETGATLVYIKARSNGLFDMKGFTSLLSKRTKLVSLVHVSNVLGVINPVGEIVKKAHKIGARVCIDGSQSAPRMPIDVKKLQCDFFAFTGHKMCGPTGIGALYAKKEILTDMPPFLGGGDMIREVYLDHSTYNDIPYKFEAGTPNIAGAIAFAHALKYLNRIGMDVVYSHEKELTAYALKKLSSLPFVTHYGSSDSRHKTGVLSFNVEGVHPHDVAQLLDQNGIAVRSGFHCAMPLHQSLSIPSTVRASFYIYNTKKEIDVFIQSLKKIYKLFH